MDRPSIDVYEERAAEWAARRAPRTTDHASRFAAAVRSRRRNALIADLGCGPGWYTGDLGVGPVVAVDGARAMLDLVPRYAPDAWRVQADLQALPFRRGRFDAAWASKSYVHLARADLPLALADLHRSLIPHALAEVVLFRGDMDLGEFADDDFSGRRFSLWGEGPLRDVVTGAGFELESLAQRSGKNDGIELQLQLRRLRTLPDYIGPKMRLLIVGLNPSLYAADAGTGFARPGNRFWPAAIEAGLVARDRDPFDALKQHGVGMTDLAKRATVRADELAPHEYRDGFARVERLVAWLQPRVVCVVGLTGWRTAVDRKAIAGRQPTDLADVPVYVMPNTSGLNARVPISELTDHLRAARDLAA